MLAWTADWVVAPSARPTLLPRSRDASRAWHTVSRVLQKMDCGEFGEESAPSCGGGSGGLDF